MKYRKKPIEIEAHQWFKNGDHPEDDIDHKDREGKIVRYFRRPDIDGKMGCGECGLTFHQHGWIDTSFKAPDATGHRVCPGDWIITGLENERYPCKPDIFNATYDLVPTLSEKSFEYMKSGLPPA